MPIITQTFPPDPFHSPLTVAAPPPQEHPGLLALCVIAGPIAVAHPDWSVEDIAEAAERVARACAARCPAAREAAPEVEVTLGGKPLDAAMMRDLLAMAFAAS